MSNLQPEDDVLDKIDPGQEVNIYTQDGRSWNGKVMHKGQSIVKLDGGECIHKVVREKITSVTVKKKPTKG